MPPAVLSTKPKPAVVNVPERRRLESLSPTKNVPELVHDSLTDKFNVLPS